MNPLLHWLLDGPRGPAEGWPSSLVRLHLIGDIAILTTMLVVPLMLGWAAATSPERDELRFRVWWKLGVFFLAVGGIQAACIATMLGYAGMNLVGVAKLVAGALGLFMITPATWKHVQRLRNYAPPEVMEALRNENEDLHQELIRRQAAVARQVERLMGEYRTDPNEQAQLHELARRVAQNTERIRRLARSSP